MGLGILCYILWGFRYGFECRVRVWSFGSRSWSSKKQAKIVGSQAEETLVKVESIGGCQNYGPFLDPYYKTAPNI